MVNEILTILINNGIGVACAAAVLWFAWYRETKTIPAILSRYDAVLKTFEEMHQRGVETQGHTHETMQAAFASRNAKSLEVFTQLVREERTNYQRWHEENRQRLEEMSHEIRDNRHLIHNFAHQLGLKQALETQLSQIKQEEQP